LGLPTSQSVRREMSNVPVCPSRINLPRRKSLIPTGLIFSPSKTCLILTPTDALVTLQRHLLPNEPSFASNEMPAVTNPFLPSRSLRGVVCT
jgi:hypothetical protein